MKFMKNDTSNLLLQNGSYCNKLKLQLVITFMISLWINTNVYAGSAAIINFEFNLVKTTPLLHPPYISGIVGDTNDIAFAKGIVLSVKENDKPIAANDYQIKVSSSNENIVSSKNVLVEKNNGEVIIKIKASAVGYSNITLSVVKGKNSEELIINYAASATNKQLQTLWHTGFADASAAIPLDENYMLVGDDENNVLSVYDSKQSGLPTAIFNYEKQLNSSDDGSKEIDCEAAVRSIKNKNLIYWTGSMGNGGKHFEEKPNRSSLIATECIGSGINTKFKFKNNYTELRRELIKWGDKNGYQFSSSAATGEKPKQLAGFNVEGMVFAPDNTTLYIAFRAPLVSITARKNALIAPIKNFEDWYAAGHQSKKIVIDTPIELNLDGRAFRDVIKLSNNKYLIVAGNADAEKNAAIYLWSGLAKDLPILISIKNISDLNIEAAVEVIENGKYTGKVQLLCDDGSTEFYNDGVAAKHLATEHKKFRSIMVSIEN